jgi:glycosyltransferase involved in cell wall biosynthesis
MHIAFITVGDPTRLTGGYLYHAQLFAGLRAQGIVIDEIVASGAALDEQRAAAQRWGATFDARRYDIMVIDALARGVVAPSFERWHALRPVVVLVHQLPSIAEADDAQIATERALEASLLRADHLIAVSEHGRTILTARGVTPEHIAVVPPGFDRLPVPSPSSLAEGWRGRGRRGAGLLRALCVAQWVPRKGITTLIKAWTLGRWPNAVLELIGETDADPAYAQEVQQLIDQAPAGSILVRGVVEDDDLFHAYQQADLFVLPSRFEGYGMVYAEALVYGLPIVACHVGPVPALVTHAAGLFVPPDDPPALAATIDRLICNKLLRQELAAGARRRATSLPSWDDTVHGFRHVLDAAIRQQSC